MQVRTREIPPEQDFILKNKKFEHILSWSIMLVIIGLFAGFFGYFIYSNTQNLYSGFMIGSNIFSLFYIFAVHSRVDGEPIQIQGRKRFQKHFSLNFYGLILLLIVGIYSVKGVYGIFITLNILLILYVIGSILFFLGKLFIKFLSGFFKSKMIFREDINLLRNIEIHTSKNIEQSMKYYNSNKLKNDFQSYFFWKNIGDASKIFLAMSFIVFIILIFSFTLFSSIIFSILIGLFIVSPTFYKFFLTLKNIDNIQIKTLSLSPKTYAWKNKNTLYFK